MARNSTNLLVEKLLIDNQNIMRDGKHYYGLSDKANTPGRNQDSARTAADDLANGNAVDWTKYQFFTNPLTPVDVQHDLFHKPAQRVTCGPRHIFTYEFDEKDLGFFQQQLKWFRYSGGELNCPIGELFTALSSYTDFCGISACYSGNKSFHIHVVFDPSAARATYNLSDVDVDLRAMVIPWIGKNRSRSWLSAMPLFLRHQRKSSPLTRQIEPLGITRTKRPELFNEGR